MDHEGAKRGGEQSVSAFERAIPWVAALFGLGAVAALIVVQLVNNGGKANTTTLGLFAVGLVLLFVVAAPRHASQALARITKLKLGALEFGLKEIKRAARVRPVPGEWDGVLAPREPEFGYHEIVEELQGRLRFVRLILEFGGKVREEDGYRGAAAWLREHGLLNQVEEAFILDLIEGTGVDVAEWDVATREDFLDSAYSFSTRFGPRIWDRWVRRRLREDGWFIAEYEQKSGHRPDFLAYLKGQGRWALMTARVGGTSPDYEESAAGRLRKFSANQLINSRVIILPDIREGKAPDQHVWRDDRPDGVRVLKLGPLSASPELAFDVSRGG